jgi:hypothetical protein
MRTLSLSDSMVKVSPSETASTLPRYAWLKEVNAAIAESPERNVETCQAENDKGHCGEPVREPLKGLEADDLLARTPCRNAQPSHDQIGGAQNRDHAEDHDRAAPTQENFVEIIPRSSGRLDQHACF